MRAADGAELYDMLRPVWHIRASTRLLRCPRHGTIFAARQHLQERRGRMYVPLQVAFKNDVPKTRRKER